MTISEPSGKYWKMPDICCRLTLPNRDFNETWHLHTCRQHQSTYLHSTDTRNKWMKELNNFFTEKIIQRERKKTKGGTPFSAHLTVHFLCRWKLFPLFVIHNRPLQVFRVPLATLLSIWIFLFHRIISRQFFCVVRCSSPFLIRRISQLFKKWNFKSLKKKK